MKRSNYPHGFWFIYLKMKTQNFGESMCDETKLKVLKWITKEFQKKKLINK